MNFSASIVFFGVDGYVAGFILLCAAKGPQQSAHRHAGVEFLREADAAGIAELLFDRLGAFAQVVIGVRAVGETDL